MADNTQLPVPSTSGDVIAADDIGGVKHQRVKIIHGAEGTNDGDVSSANPLPVNTGLTQALTDAQLRASAVPVSASSLPLPTGAATQATLSAIDGYFKAEDSAAASGDKGLPLLAIRQVADTTSTDADGDYTLLKVDEEGRLKVASKPASYPDITGDITAIQATIGTPVAGGTVEGDVSRASNLMIFCTGTFSTVNCTFEGSLESSGNTNWFAVQVVRSNANTIELATGNLSAQPAYAWEASVNALKRFRVRATARTSGTQSWRFVQGTYATEPIPAAQISGTQPVSGTVTATVVTPTTTFTNSAASTNATVTKASAGTVWSILASNINAATRYLKLYNKATAPTVGTDIPVIVIPIPAGQTVNFHGGSNGIRFATGIGWALTTGAADNDTGAVSASEHKIGISFT